MSSDKDLERALRDTVGRICDSGDLTDLTVNRVRARVEQELDLATDFFRQAKWKTQSKAIIEEEALKHSQPEPIQSIESVQPTEANSSKRSKTSSSTKTNATDRKRKTPGDLEDSADSAATPVAKRSRHKAAVISDDDEEEGDEDEEDNRARPRSSSSVSKVPGPRGSASMINRSNTKSPAKTSGATPAHELSDLSDGDLSEVIDDIPSSKRKAQTQTQKTSAPSQKTTKSKTSKVTDANSEEIKKLQRQLVECGIRKVWGKELKPYETSREKIKHLKKMLIDAGMTGRYSKEKAASIREARELAADLEAVQEGAKRWGKDADPAQRRVNKKIRSPIMDFLDDDMMEE